jgi:hypothetical protein
MKIVDEHYKLMKIVVLFLIAAYMPHASLLYGDLTDEEKEVARKKVEELDKDISGLQFEISEVALYRTDTEDKTLESWELVEVSHLEKKCSA